MQQTIKDVRLKKNLRASDLVKEFERAGFQASELARAARLMREMTRDKHCTKFLAFTANLVASGLRRVIADFIRRGHADIVVTTGGAVDHDVIKSYAPYLAGDFFMDDIALHKRGVNRLGNILVPNARYELLERKLQPILRKAYAKKKVWATSELIQEIAGTLRDKNSFLRACFEKRVPAFSPGIVDSALGLQLFFFKQDCPDFVLDEGSDLKKLAGIVLSARRTGAVVLGGGISKHFTIGSNILRGGLNYAVYFTTATPFDGSLSGAVTQEAKSWGKLKERARSVTVFGDATIAFPLAASALL